MSTKLSAPVALRIRVDQVEILSRRHGYASTAALAEAMGWNRGNLYRLLNGTRGFSTSFVARLCSTLHAQFDELFTIEPVSEPDGWES